MLLKILEKLPIVQVLAPYPKAAHWRSFKKFLFLWILSILPILFAITLTRTGDSNIWERLKHEFSATEMFVYAASFLPPVLFMFYEKVKEYKIYMIEGRRDLKGIKFDPKGFGLVLAVALLMFVYTAFAYGASRLRQEVSAVVDIQLSSVAAIVVYVYSLFCWYLLILFTIPEQEFDYVAATRQQSTELQIGLSSRVGRGGK